MVEKMQRLQGRRVGMAEFFKERIDAAIGEEEKTLTKKTTLAGFSKEDHTRWV